MIYDAPPKIWMPPKPAIIRSGRDIVRPAMLPGLIPFCGARTAPTVCTFITSVPDTTAQTTYNFGTVSIGTAAADRDVIVVFVGTSNTGSREMSSASIGGNAATIDIDSIQVTATFECYGAIFRLRVTSGTSANITAVMNGGGFQRAAIGVYTVTGGSGAPTATLGVRDTIAAPTGTINVLNGSSLIGGGMWNGTSPGAITWTGIANENVDTTIGTTGRRYSYANEVMTADQTGRTVTATSGSGTTASSALVAAAYSP